MSKVQHEDKFENVEQVLSKTEQFIEEKQTLLITIIAVVIVLVGGYWGLKKLYFQPREITAQESLYNAQMYFEKDSFNLALNGDGNSKGFLEIAKKYSSTKAGNLAHYYTGLCFLHTGKFNEAIDHLKDFSSDDEIVTYMAKGATGDAYYEQGNRDKAISYYIDATKTTNEMVAPTYLMKLGMAYEDAGNYAKAVEAYKRIKDEFKNSADARMVDKYLARAELMVKK
jgi:tetratricopeptide (TPR) repeat protein